MVVVDAAQPTRTSRCQCHLSAHVCHARPTAGPGPRHRGARSIRPPRSLMLSGRCSSRCCLPPGNTGGQGRAPGEASAAAGPGCDLLPGPRRDRLAAAARGLPAVPDRVRLLPPMGTRRDLAASPRRAAGPGARARGPGPAPDRGGHRLAVGAWRRHGPGASRGYDAGKKVKGRKRHIAVDTLGLLLAVVVTEAGIQDRDGGARLLAALRPGCPPSRLIWADGGYAGRLVPWAKNVLVHRAGRQAHRRRGRVRSCPAGGSSSERSRGSASTAAASGTTRPCPNTTRPWSTYDDHGHVPPPRTHRRLVASFQTRSKAGPPRRRGVGLTGQ